MSDSVGLAAQDHGRAIAAEQELQAFSYIVPPTVTSVSPNSATDPMQRRSSHFSHFQTGSGVPQYRQRDSDQSTSDSSQLPMRPVLM